MNNTGVIFRRALRDARTPVIAWGIGMALITMLVMVLYPTIQQFEGIAELMENPIFSAMLGEAADAAAFTTPEGFTAVYVLTFTPLYLAAYLVWLGLGVTIREEDRGTVDVLLSLPIPRWQVIVEKAAAIVVILLVILLFVYGGALLSVVMIPELELAPLRLAEGVFNMLPVMLLITTITLFFSTVLRSGSMAAGITAAIIVISYFVNSLADVATEALGTVKYLSFFTYSRGLRVMLDGIIWGDVLVLLAVTAALFAASLWAYQRRDLYT